MVSINRNLGAQFQKVNNLQVNKGTQIKTPVKVGGTQAKPMSDRNTFDSWEDYTKNKPKNPEQGKIVTIDGVRFQYVKAQSDGSMCLYPMDQKFRQ